MIINRLTLFVACTGAWLVLAGAVEPARCADKDEPSKLQLDGARYRLEKFEQKVKLARGAKIRMGFTENEALKMISALKDKYPDNPQVEDLFQRARKAVLASEGKIVEMSDDVLLYRKNQEKLAEIFKAEGEKEWAAFKEKALSGGAMLPKAFPAPSHHETDLSDLRGKYVVLEDFEYPSNEFMDLGRQFCWVGSGARGHYFVELSNRAWIGAYEAVKRYRRFVNPDVPEGMKWTLVGKITGLELLVPEAAKEKTLAAVWGWSVEPVAIYVPDRTFALADPELELGGRFAGEQRMEQLKGSMYSVKSIPDDVTPERLTEIFITAIKEKNYELYLACIDPARTKTPTGRSRCMYHWEWHQHRFATFYCRVDVGKADIRVIQGFDDSGDSLKARFLTPEEREKLKQHSEPLVEEAELKTTAFDERGKQYGSPKPRFFRRTEKKRWYIINYDQPF